MASANSDSRATWTPWVAAGAVLIVGLLATGVVTAIIAEEQGALAQREAERAGSQIALQLETSLIPAASVAHALEAYAIGESGSLDRADTERFMTELLDAAPVVRVMSLAPGNRIEHIAPLEGNEAAVGLDLSSVPDQWEPIRAVIASGEPALIGPFELVQGGVGLAYRRPIVLPGSGYWGLASAVIDADTYLDAAVDSADVAPGLVGIRSSTQGESAVFWGAATAFAPDAVITPSRPLGTSWEVGVLPPPTDPIPLVVVVVFGVTSSLLLSGVTLLALRLRLRRREAANQLARLSAQTPGMLYQVRVHPDGSTVLEYASDRIETIFGLTRADVAGHPGALWSRVDPADRTRVRAELRRCVTEHVPWHSRLRMAAADGTVRWFQSDATLEIRSSGDVILHGYLADISSEMRTEERLRISASVFDSTRDGVVLMDPSGRIIDVNAGFTELLGFDLVDVQGRGLEFLGSGATPPDVYDELRSALERTGSWQGELIHRRKDGEVALQAVSITSVLDDTGRLSHHVAVLSALSSITTDLVTGLPSRLVAEDRLARDLDRARMEHAQMGLIVVSLDRFRDVNESLGHRVGDVVLKEVAGRLRFAVPEPQTVARLGGDEFAVILGNEVTPETVIGVASAISDALREPIRMGARDVRLTASMGIALYPSDADSAADLLTAASQAVRASSSGMGGRITFFTAEMQEASRDRVRITDDLHSAVAQGQMSIVLQPVVDLATGRTTKAEALMRWTHPELGAISPERFIPLAEASGQIGTLDDWMFSEVLDLTARARTLSPDFQVGFNLSPVEIVNSGTRHQQRITIMKQRGIPGDALIAEITEGVLLSPGSDSERNLQIYRDAGVELAIDDFGTRYSSLAYLQSLDVDFLKIDRSFVHDLAPGNASHTLCIAIIEMAHALGLRVIAEGVETPQQRDLLTAAGCDRAQGYLFAKPLPPEDLWDRLRGERVG